ncbi:MAG: diguanylate cyclase [Alphaproteobacteria bacterium]|nr:diguanylate cyclase [Alphaproteobacteria bacterium]
MTSIFSNLIPRAKTRRKTILELVSGNDAFNAYPGPVVILDAAGNFLAGNDEASRLAVVLRFGAISSMDPCLREAILAGVPANVPFSYDHVDAATGQLEHRTYDFQVLPVESNELIIVVGRNTAFESAFRGALAESRQRYKDLVEVCGDFSWETDSDGRFVFVSPSGALGYTAEQLVGSLAECYLHDVGRGLSPFATDTQVSDIDIWFKREDAGLACLEVSARPVHDASGTYRGARGVCRDVTADRDREQELARTQVRENLIAHIIRTIRDEIEPAAMLDAAARITAQAVDAAGCTILRIDQEGNFIEAVSFGSDAPDNLTIASLLTHLHSDGHSVEVNRDGLALLMAQTSCRQENNGAIVLWRDEEEGAWSMEECAVTDDVAVHMGVALQQISYQLELETLSRTDPLTGLLNRRAFTGELESRVQRAAETGAHGALIYIDLDNFKPVNDILGHQKGDEALVAVSTMLTQATRPGDLIARLGGDEFALWLDRTGEDAAAARAEEMLEASCCLAPYSGDPERPLGISIGIAVHLPVSNESVDGLTSRADDAMYDVKNNGKAGYAIAPAVVEHNEQAISK